MHDAHVHFKPVEEIAAPLARAFESIRAEVLTLLPGADVEHIGASSIPGAITKGDLDVLVRVAPDGFDPAARALSARFDVHQPENWSPTFASFSAGEREGIPVGVQLAAAGSRDDRQFTFLRDLLRERPDLLERLNALKRSHDGGDAEAYWRAKQDLIESMLAEEGLDEP